MMSPTQKDCHSFQLIDGKGEFNEKGLHNFITATNLYKCGVDYAVIAIVGPQSSGKSTFMNHFGGTNFKEMDSMRGRGQITQGIWISKCVAIHRPFTIALDIEGTDGEERGEDTAFEEQSALFALTVADTLIVNLWCHDIGRQRASSIPLLQTILQIRMARMGMYISRRKAKLCFLLRDMEEETPLELLEEKIKSNMEKIWTTIARLNGFERTNISDFFHILVFGLSHYKYQKKEFKDQVAELREKIISVDREGGVVPAVAFQANAHQLWKCIKEEPFLNLPAHSDMIAEHMCKEIANAWLKSLSSSEDLMELKKEVEAWPVHEFGDKLHCLMETTLSKYISEVQHFKEHIVKEREKVLKSEILEILHPLYVTMLGHVRNETFQEFKMMLTKLQRKGETFVVAYERSYDICKLMFEEQCKDVIEKLSAGWDWFGCNKELCNEIENYASSIRSASISKHKEECQFKDSTEEIVKEVMSDMKTIKRVKGKETGMQVMSVVSECAGAVAKPQEEGKNVNNELNDYMDLNDHANVSATNEREPLGENLLPPETPEIVYGDHSEFEIKLTGMELSELPKAEEWERSKLIHLNDSQLLKLPENPRCTVLEDLSLKGSSKLRTIPPLFFDRMPALRVLDLSRTRIKSLPDSLFSLPELKSLFLKHCNLLMKLSPKVGQLKGLQVLDFEGTEIMNLPEEVKELKNLLCLKVSFCELPSYRRVEEPDVRMISPGTLSALLQLEGLSINVSPDDGRWNECVKHVVSEVSVLPRLDKLQFYFPSVEFLSRFDWFRFRAFKLTAGHLAAKRLMPRLPSDAEVELERYDKSFTSVHGDFESEMNNPALQYADALFLDRHTTLKTLSMFGLDSFKHIRCFVVGECNELEVLFCVGQPPHVSLEYLYLYYMKSLRSIWKGNVAPHAFLNLKSLTLRTCPLLSSIFTSDSIGILKCLLEIIIDDCPAITTLVSCNTDTAYNFLPSLKRISLHYLPRLNGIFDLSLSRDLEWMSIYHCPNLKSLTIYTASNKKLKKIMGERSWWRSLEWQDTKHHLWDDVFEEQEFCY